MLTVGSIPFPVEGFSGVVRIGDEAWVFGCADRAHAVPNSVDTQFALASGTKGLTAVVAVNTLSLDLRARELLGDYLPLVDERVTVEHLLRHTSGVGDYLDEEVYGDSEEHLMPVSAGMTDTAFLRSDSLPATAAIGYLADGRTNVFHLPVRGSGDGGIYSTAADMEKFWRIVPEWMTRGKGYGLGFWLDPLRLEGSDAGTGFTSVAGRWTVLTNDPSTAGPVARALREHRTGGIG